VNDLRETAIAFEAALSARGVPAATMRTVAFLRALNALQRVDARDLYWAGRIAMLPSIDFAARFDDAFAAVFAGEVSLTRPGAPGDDAPAHEITKTPRESPRTMPGLERAEADERAPVKVALASSEEQLRERDFAALSDEERELAERIFRRLRVAGERRRSRRLRAAVRGRRFDWRSTARGSLRTLGEVVRKRYATRRLKLRPLLFLCDVSGSMAPYARALLRYAHLSAMARPKVRAFAFATRLSDLSAMLREHDAGEALGRAAEALRDFGGGTRIGAALREFNDRYAQRGATRSATVTILSDGWEREDPALVGRQMARLRRLARRIVWVNPQKKHPAYEPLARGMAAALPYIDAFIEGHNLRSLDAIADAIEGTT
jgi:uncharacterized protein with von Willebrand factor type A (vWA) domain